MSTTCQFFKTVFFYRFRMFQDTFNCTKYLSNTVLLLIIIIFLIFHRICVCISIFLTKSLITKIDTNNIIYNDKINYKDNIISGTFTISRLTFSVGNSLIFKCYIKEIHERVINVRTGKFHNNLIRSNSLFRQTSLYGWKACHSDRSLSIWIQTKILLRYRNEGTTGSIVDGYSIREFHRKFSLSC